MERPERWEGRKARRKVLVIWEAVQAGEVWQDDEIPKKERRGHHQVDSPEEEGEEDLKSEGEQVVVLVFRGGIKVVHRCEQSEEGQDGRGPDVGEGEDVVLESSCLVLDQIDTDGDDGAEEGKAELTCS